MNKFFSLFCAVLFCANLSAQTLNESFEGEDFPPEGWTTYASLASASWKKSTKFGQVCAMVQGTYQTENWLITPQLKPASGEKLTFSACIGDYSSKGELRVEVSLAGTDKESFEVVETYYTSSKAETNGLWKSEWKEYTVDLSKYQGQRIYVAFHQIYEADRIYLDDVKGLSIAGGSTCENPTNLVVSNLSSEHATVSWLGAADEYEYVCVEKGDEPDWTEATKISAKTVTLDNLYAETSYEFYVRSVCAEGEVSLAPKVAFKTPCEAHSIPWIETFTRDATGAFAPDCWTVASANPQVWVVADKTYSEEGEAQTVFGQAHLGVSGGGPNTEQVFALPMFDAQLNTLEIAFDYHTNMVDANYGVPEIGYMTNPSKASTFISLQTLTQTLTDKHMVVTLEDLPADAKFIAFRFAGGTSDLGSLSMDNFVVAEIGKSGEVDPADEDFPDPSIWGQTYCEAQFTWYSYTASAFAIGLFEVSSEALVAGIVATTGECDRFAYVDGIGFPEDDDYENHYYCSTKWILNVDEDGIQKGDAWDSSVINVGTAVTPQLGLKEGSYQVQVYELVNNGTSYSKGELLATIPFTLVDRKIANLKAEVASDKQTATLTWDAPAMGSGERLYVSVRAGETVAYDNYDTNQKPASPLTVNVEDGKSYTAIVQLIDKNKNPLGSEVQTNFTVGENAYEPKNPHAEVFGGDNTTFSWEAGTEADRYVITLYLDGAYYSSLTVSGMSKTTTMPKDGTWTWTVQAFNQGANGNYFEVSNAIEGNSFESKAADIPEDAVVWNIWGFDAAYLDEASGYYQEGKYGWYITFATGDEDGTGYPMPSFLLYTAKENAISGVYNVARGNIDLESCYVNTTGRQEDAIWATDAEVRLQFDGYDEEKAEYGYRYGYYTGQFRLVGNDGKTYVGKFMEQFCNSYNFSSMGTGLLDHKGMWDEDPDYIPYQGIDEISTKEENALKMLRDGQLIIIRNGHEYNAAGTLIR